MVRWWVLVHCGPEVQEILRMWGRTWPHDRPWFWEGPHPRVFSYTFFIPTPHYPVGAWSMCNSLQPAALTKNPTNPSIPNKRQGISLATFVVCGGLGNIWRGNKFSKVVFQLTVIDWHEGKIYTSGRKHARTHKHKHANMHTWLFNNLHLSFASVDF